MRNHAICLLILLIAVVPATAETTPAPGASPLPWSSVKVLWAGPPGDAEAEDPALALLRIAHAREPGHPLWDALGVPDVAGDRLDFKWVYDNVKYFWEDFGLQVEVGSSGVNACFRILYGDWPDPETVYIASCL